MIDTKSEYYSRRIISGIWPESFYLATVNGLTTRRFYKDKGNLSLFIERFHVYRQWKPFLFFRIKEG